MASWIASCLIVLISSNWFSSMWFTCSMISYPEVDTCLLLSGEGNWFCARVRI